jgi:hypothetical protein
LISKLKPFVIVSILMVAAAAISAIAVTRWHPFAPKDYEECADHAARDAKSKDALAVLLSVCRSDFEGRRKRGGGYTFYDQCKDQNYDIDGPNPTPDEMKYIEGRCQAYLDLKSRMDAEDAELARKKQQAAQEARIAAQQAETAASAALHARVLAAIPAIHVAANGFKDCELYNSVFCKLSVEVANGSKEALSRIVIGLSNVAAVGDACPSSYAAQFWFYIKLSPGEKRGTTVDVHDIEFSKHPLCIKVLGVEFADR